jgi:hypothetical protein
MQAEREPCLGPRSGSAYPVAVQATDLREAEISARHLELSSRLALVGFLELMSKRFGKGDGSAARSRNTSLRISQSHGGSNPFASQLRPSPRRSFGTFSRAVLCWLPSRPICTGAVILALSELTGCSWTS